MRCLALALLIVANVTCPAEAATLFLTGLPSTPRVSWVKLTTNPSPPARAGQAMAYDPVSRKVVMFGGFDATAYLNDTWTFDGKKWTKQVTAVAPPARASATMTFDAVRKTLVLFGGFRNPQFLGDTWIWDGQKMAWKAAHPKVSPPAMGGSALFTDPIDGQAVLFGGSTGEFYQLDTWRWSGNDWRQLNPATRPSARAFMAASVDLKTRSAVIFGGLADVNPVNTWTWNGAQWVHQFPKSQLPWRYSPGAAYDPSLRDAVVFGGGSGGADLNDTWAWTGATWVALSPAVSPPPRESFGMSYDAALGHIVIFGGLLNRGPARTLLNDTWELMSR